MKFTPQVVFCKPEAGKENGDPHKDPVIGFNSHFCTTAYRGAGTVNGKPDPADHGPEHQHQEGQIVDPVPLQYHGAPTENIFKNQESENQGSQELHPQQPSPHLYSKRIKYRQKEDYGHHD